MANIDKILSCGFSNDLVSYLYGEMNLSAINEFETHLPDCNSCTEEFAGLSLARLGVYEWHRDEFRHLNTPLIEIPYSLVNSEDSVRSSWLDVLRGVFASAPRLATAGGAFAALAIVLGITLIASNIFRNDSNLTVTNNETAPPSSEINSITLPAVPKVEQEVVSADLRDDQPANPSVAAVAKNRNPGYDHRIPDSISMRSRKKATSPPSNRGLQAVSRENLIRTPRRATPPQLTDFRDEEDNTLRLSDLFADVDTAGR